MMKMITKNRRNPSLEKIMKSIITKELLKITGENETDDGRKFELMDLAELKWHLALMQAKGS